MQPSVRQRRNPMPHGQADTIASRALLARLRETIKRDGPIGVDRYMQLCLADPQHGYWQRTATIGANGDFVTAPEISQIFGELIGLWSATVWQLLGQPAPVRLVELGPGRGTLMCDALRSAQALSPFSQSTTVHLVELSAPLRVLQQQALRAHADRTSWHDNLADVPAGPAIVVANEFLDALPVRQLVFSGGTWRERVVDLTPDGDLRFAVGSATAYASPAEPEEGAIAELRPGEDELLATLAERNQPVVALFIDYGPSEASPGDTLQGVRRHAYVDPLQPDAADLTAHVQFSEWARKARAAGLATDGPITQAEFLARLGIAERASRLMSANPKRAGEIEAAVHRLISPTGMGSLFKVMVVRSPALSPPLPFG
jgi:NADH dehydrogenase [ubiquinone] 1 alpha subcomplex assembly factor 7